MEGLYKTCSCPFVRYFRTLFWDDIIIIWDENIVYFFNWEKNMFGTNKKFVYLIFINKLSWYHPKITYENIVQKDMNKFIITKTLMLKHRMQLFRPPRIIKAQIQLFIRKYCQWNSGTKKAMFLFMVFLKAILVSWSLYLSTA